MITREKLPVSRHSFHLLPTQNEDWDNPIFSCDSSLKYFFSTTFTSFEMDDHLAIVPYQRDPPWLQTCGDRAELCAGEAVPSPGKEERVPPMNELSATRHAERNAGGRRNRRRHLRKQRKKPTIPPEMIHLDSIKVEMDRPSGRSTSSREWQRQSLSQICEDSFLTDDEAEGDEDDQHNMFINRDTPRYSSSARTRTPEGGDSDPGGGYRNHETRKWFERDDFPDNRMPARYSSVPIGSWEESDDQSDSNRLDVNTPRTSINVLPTWMRVPCVGKDSLALSPPLTKKITHDGKKIEVPNKIKKKRKKSKAASRQLETTASSSEETVYGLPSAAGLSKHSKGAGPVKWFRRGKGSKSGLKTNGTNCIYSTPLDCLQLPAPEGSILKRPPAVGQSKLKKKVRWASDLLQVRYFRTDVVVPPRYYPTPHRPSNRISSYDLDVLLFPWQDTNHASYENYMHYIQ